MQDEIASRVYSVFNHALRLKQRLENNEEPDLQTEQSTLKGLLLTDLEARRWVDFGGEGSADRNISMTSMGASSRRESFMGIRFALVCWLDEIFIRDSPWSRNWNEYKLETQLYGTNLRAELFWEQARRAEARPGSDALEACYLCVMLGFRGELREEPEKLQQWVTNTQARLTRSQGAEFPMPPEQEPPTSVPPHHGREKLQKMVLIAGMVALSLILVTAFLIVKKTMG